LDFCTTYLVYLEKFILFFIKAQGKELPEIQGNTEAVLPILGHLWPLPSNILEFLHSDSNLWDYKVLPLFFSFSCPMFRFMTGLVAQSVM
jgi:hypothetical protein